MDDLEIRIRRGNRELDGVKDYGKAGHSLFRNASRAYDPTAGEALMNILKDGVKERERTSKYQHRKVSSV